MNAPLERTTFSTSRAAEFLQTSSLVSQTGQPIANFGDVVLKELLDNALDAAETAGAAPHITVAVEVSGDVQKVAVTDNGTGIPAGVIERILNFDTLTSDKAAYRSPTRGLQGNATKTIIGMPFALGVTEPIVIDACGYRHLIKVTLDPGGNVRVEHDTQPSTRTTGTAFTVPLPIGMSLDAGRWVRAFAACNPHALIEHGPLADPTGITDPRTYKPAVPDGWRKPSPTDPIPAHWYDEQSLTRLVFAHVGAADHGGRDKPVGEFIREFPGLSGTAKAKTVLSVVEGITHLSGFRNRPDLIGPLLAAMQGETREPKHTVLGRVEEDHYRAVLDDAYGVERMWFRRKGLVVDGVPWQIEVALAETRERGGVVFATNYSASFGDPLGMATLAHGEVSTQGAESFLRRCDAYPEYGNDSRRAVIMHVTCAAPSTLDKGKVRLVVPAAVAEEFAAVLGAATKDLKAEAKRRNRDARAESSRREQHRRAAEQPKVTTKAAVFTVMAEAIAHTSGNGEFPIPQRNLFYAVRDRIQRHGCDFAPGKDGQNYFYKLLTAYQREHGPIAGLCYDPRGELHEPHTGKTVPLGTRDVAGYVLPDHVFDKILYVEKEGFGPIFQRARLMERYDLAIAGGKGQPVEAIRALFERAQAGDYKLFVLHDADPAGYSIARTIAEETDRMPGYSVDVIDLGLTVDDAIDRGLPTEGFTRGSALPWWMPERLTPRALEWFEGTQVAWHPKPQWAGTRVELNAFAAPALIAYIEAGLEANGATGKVIPPGELVEAEARRTHRTALRVIAADVLDELLNIEALISITADTLGNEYEADVTRGDVEDALDRNPYRSWRDATTGLAERHVAELREEIRNRALALYAGRGIGGTT